VEAVKSEPALFVLTVAGPGAVTVTVDDGADAVRDDIRDGVVEVNDVVDVVLVLVGVDVKAAKAAAGVEKEAVAENELAKAAAA